MKILLIFTLYLISGSLLSGGGASSEVSGYSGGGVLIKCKYHTDYTSKPKYFCKRTTLCTKQISTEVKNKWVNTGRFSLIDNTSSAEFWVMIRELTVEDSGTYQCRVAVEWWPDNRAEMELKINEDIDYKKSISVKGHVGQTVNISCKYPQSLSSKPKFLCRRRSTVDCYYTASVKESKRWIKEGKFSLYDEKARKTFTVSISRVTEGDSGEYWCGAESDWESDHGYKIYFTQINLRVTEPGQPDTSTPSRSFTQQSMKTTLKNSEQPQQPLVTTNTPATEFPTFFVITVVSVILVLLLIGLLVFVVILRKRVKARASTSIQSTRGSSNTNTVYEEIKDTKRHPSPDSGASTVHQLPTNPSDPSHTLYDNVQLGQCPNPIYSTAPEQIINSTPQIPTSSSGSSASTAEDPAYATVKFTKNYNVTAKVNMKEESCDYATVKHASGTG
ncbi:CMRF35-like molecule 1 isoform X2 [Astyanax mexicanus]|uniref:CMRF35-like molecule 1 isoform X2 n=1 Tax=Astyanax mexicanus TaxID=7994 RepID=UPI0020CAA917|nr:CMRF35-like molecule 1 isoform X2 [Astyanax mexicanus]